MTIRAVLLFPPADYIPPLGEGGWWLQTMCDSCLKRETGDLIVVGKISDPRIFCQECGEPQEAGG